ncbi:deleted in malignant brain tumors 1 protein-like [Lytechinus variegatus]|uniref:deleted in malignant brain tumors 1 protein-like n=1 Tax=Lytechinus variegatus TaxID=7654 RepID=UPI001BB1FBD4|nr:deleted in malignant brain tumors 1 protein-like [Lytechinus variegatus]
MLGFGGALEAPRSARFGQGSGRILLNWVQCDGSEDTFADCIHPGIGDYSYCGHNKDAGVVCFLGVRLADGASDNEGRVEILHEGTWGTVCDDFWDLDDATVVCRHLGFEGALAALPQAYFGEGSGDILLDGVQCNGSESNLKDCNHSGIGVHNCAHKEDAGVICRNTAHPNPFQVRLVGGSNYAEGRVEVLHDGSWGTICDDLWDLRDARVVCRMLGFDGALEAPGSTRFGQGSGTILLDDLGCIGSENNLAECPHRGTGVNNCGHAEDAGAICYTGDPLRIRIAGGSNDAEGRVEVQHDGSWGTVCDDWWDLRDAWVVCRMMGFDGALEAPVSARFGKGSGRVLLKYVNCKGTEDNLADCAHPGIGRYSCSHSRDAGAICYSGGKLVVDFVNDISLRIQF